MPLDHLTSEELVQFVWTTSGQRTELEHKLAEALARALDEVEDNNFSKHD